MDKKRYQSYKIMIGLADAMHGAVKTLNYRIPLSALEELAFLSPLLALTAYKQTRLFRNEPDSFD